VTLIRYQRGHGESFGPSLLARIGRWIAPMMGPEFAGPCVDSAFADASTGNDSARLGGLSALDDCRRRWRNTRATETRIEDAGVATILLDVVEVRFQVFRLATPNASERRPQTAILSPVMNALLHAVLQSNK